MKLKVYSKKWEGGKYARDITVDDDQNIIFIVVVLGYSKRGEITEWATDAEFNIVFPTGNFDSAGEEIYSDDIIEDGKIVGNKNDELYLNRKRFVLINKAK